jgi:Kdo2-lipid IVA lauroyltransferase/acyltransferase
MSILSWPKKSLSWPLQTIVSLPPSKPYQHMYYFIYGFLYLLSLIPTSILYFFSDGIAALLYYVLKYRKKIVLYNLEIAFPEKTAQERLAIAKRFYRNFTDTFIETIKFLSWTMKDIDKRFTVDLSGLEKAYTYNKSIHLIGMHNFNWEFVNWGLAKKTKYPFLGIYMPVRNKAFDKIILNMRSKYGTIMLPATNFKVKYRKYLHSLHVLASAADQSPGNPDNSYWLNFFGKPTAFVTGPEKAAKLNNATVVFAHFFKTKRGAYHINTVFITEDPASFLEGSLTLQYTQFIEKCLRQQPDNYLWSHNRWKKEWNSSYEKLWIDKEAGMPEGRG